jgi:transcriptional regulator with XRE-family HTH domain
MKSYITSKHSAFASRFKLACEKIGKENLAQDELGKIFGVSGPMISNYRNGHKLPKMETACKICEVTGVSLDWLMYGRIITPESLDGDQADLLKAYLQAPEPLRQGVRKLLDVPG